MSKKRRIAKAIKAASKAYGAGPAAAGRALATARSKTKPVKERVAALAQLPTTVCGDDRTFQAVLGILQDRAEPISVRLEALQTLQAASFSVIAFVSCRSDYIATLRAIADDPEPEIRQRVLGILAREKDGYAQQTLLQGLQNPSEALVPPEKALQLLSYDVHVETYPLARAIVANPPNQAAKREALRVLAADATAAPIFEKILRDKNEQTDIRQLAASALHAVKPERLQIQARGIVLDTTEQDNILATSLTALTQFGRQETLATDHPLQKRVKRLTRATSARVKKGAQQFIAKYGQ